MNKIVFVFSKVDYLVSEIEYLIKYLCNLDLFLYFDVHLA